MFSLAMLLALLASPSHAQIKCQDVVNPRVVLQKISLRNLNPKEQLNADQFVVIKAFGDKDGATTMRLFGFNNLGSSFFSIDFTSKPSSDPSISSVSGTLASNPSVENLPAAGLRAEITKIAPSQTGESFATVNSNSKEVRIFKPTKDGFEEILRANYEAMPKNWPYNISPPPSFLPDYFVHKKQIYRIGYSTSTAFMDSFFRVGRVLERGLSNEPIRLPGKASATLLAEGSKAFSFSSLGKRGVQLDIYDLVTRVREEPILFTRNQIPHEYDFKSVAKLPNGNLVFAGNFGCLMLDSKYQILKATEYKDSSGHLFGSIESIVQDGSRVAFIGRTAQKIEVLNLIQLKWQNLISQSSTVVIANAESGVVATLEIGEPIEKVFLGAQDTLVLLTKKSFKVLKMDGTELFSHLRKTDFYGQPVPGAIAKISSGNFVFLSQEDQNFVLTW